MSGVPQTSTDEPRAVESLEPTALRLRGVTRCFGGPRVLGPVDLELEPGAVCLVEGANGAGKTTLLRVASGSLAPTSGTVEAAQPALYLPSAGGVRPEDTVGRALAWVARVTTGTGVSAEVALDLTGLVDRGGVRVAALSGGQRVRLTLALALVAGPSMVCLDEPTAHLDRAGIQHAAAAIEALADRGCALLVADPEPHDLAGLADARVRLCGGLAEVVS